MFVKWTLTYLTMDIVGWGGKRASGEGVCLFVCLFVCLSVCLFICVSFFFFKSYFVSFSFFFFWRSLMVYVGWDGCVVGERRRISH